MSYTKLSVPLMHDSSINSKNTKYDGLIDVAFFKRLRQTLFSFYSFIDYIIKPSAASTVFFSIWRLFQFFCASLCTNNVNFWGNRTTIHSFLGVIIVPAYAAPNSISSKVQVYILFGYCLIVFLYLLALLNIIHLVLL